MKGRKGRMKGKEGDRREGNGRDGGGGMGEVEEGKGG